MDITFATMLLRNLQILDPAGPLHGKTGDLRIDAQGEITEFGEGLKAREGEEVHDLEGAYASPGFTDIGAYLGDPGHEEREDRASLVAQAAAGGYARVAVLPNTEPVRQSVADVAYVLRGNGGEAVELLPLAALSHDLEGKDLTEMLILAGAGAVGFTDGPARRVSGSLLKRSLEYGRAGDLRLFVAPYDPALVPEGQMHEGEVSTRLGLRGIPAMAENIPLKRAVELLEYTGGSLVVHLLSTATGVAEVRRAKALGLNITATVGVHNLSFTEKELGGFDPNFKVLPPLRGEADRRALIEGLRDGTIDAIVSNHVARHGEEKDLEFSYADFGALSLQTAFRQCLSLVEEGLDLDLIVAKMTTGPRALLGQSPLHLRPRQMVPLSIFRTDGDSVFTETDLRGKTKNSPLLGKSLPGRIVGTVVAGKFHPVK